MSATDDFEVLGTAAFWIAIDRMERSGFPASLDDRCWYALAWAAHESIQFVLGAKPSETVWRGATRHLQRALAV